MNKALSAAAGIVLLLCSTGLVASELSRCVGVEDPLERLACYDRIAGRSAGPEAPQAETDAPTPEPAPSPHAAPAPRAAPTPRMAPVPADPEGFGLKRDQRQAAEPEHITATIVSVQTSPGGAQVMTLSNGQIWTEIEKGRRPIEPQQEVTIRRYRWHYKMELASQPDVTVRRLQ